MRRRSSRVEQKSTRQPVEDCKPEQGKRVKRKGRVGLMLFTDHTQHPLVHPSHPSVPLGGVEDSRGMKESKGTKIFLGKRKGVVASVFVVWILTTQTCKINWQ